MAGPIAGDTGGTFTDLVALSPDGTLRFSKALTTYDSPMRGLMKCLDHADVELSEATSLKFGTTLVINAYLQRNGARVAMLCTRGFRDTLEIRRGNRVDPFDLLYARDPVLVPRERRFEVDGRIEADGTVSTPLDPQEIERVGAELHRDGVQAVAISFLNAYVNDEHERLAAEILRLALPGVYITAGSDLTHEWYEYERAATAAANAYVGPALERFLHQMGETLCEAGFKRSIYLMASNGGVFSVDEARRQPVQLVESGPVGGCIGAAAYARALGLAKVIAFDMGGTTAKCALIEDGGFETRSPYYVGGVERGFPIRGSVVDIMEVGAGGGSIAALDAHGRLSVGPRSAGSTPGPVCYGRGGDAPTITDANVILGRVGEHSLLGGEMAVNRLEAEVAFYEKLARPLGYSRDQLDHVAQGVLDIAALTMSNTMSKITTERGIDPRDFTLLVFGGGGPVHGVDLARHTGIPRVIVPPHPGVFSAVGMLLAGARSDESRTFLRPLNEQSVESMLMEFHEMEKVALSRLPAVVSGSAPICERFAEVRYKGQRHSLKVAMTGVANAAAVRSAFLTAYTSRYGHGDPSHPLELFGLIVAVSQRLVDVSPASMAGAAEAEELSSAEVVRDVFFAQAGRRLPTPIVQRRSLAKGYKRSGPLIVEEYGSSTVLGPNDKMAVGGLREIVVEVGI